ncbi:hypothetical protein BLA24_21190 [Streptomyces cinnamoneus]|uniref:Uncharacterized protein n=1 Tax=Streptomyces cinnamoneus TaxID=53446 RepID=A0A2G1XFX5_STRCJ|nr:hypothetical protein [Streptomyces cinnamoneus]PHQ50105.1 hypothetical protein BLA24_21190 [Streptomyces cinnamoneus]PPT13114.1 hypothetical protein CYQ11_09595 [Streptomyces cinnamoneus]
MTWSEAEYVEYLQSERRLYAWVMRRHGNLTLPESWAAALAAYPYEPDGTPHRGLVFHDEPWHWAMLDLHGERYTVEHPELVHPPVEYTALE